MRRLWLHPELGLKFVVCRARIVRNAFQEGTQEQLSKIPWLKSYVVCYRRRFSHILIECYAYRQIRSGKESAQ